MPLLASLGSLMAAWVRYYTTKFTGSTSPTGCSSSWQWQFIGVWTAAHHRTCRTTASRSPVLTLGGICVPPTVNYLQCLVTSSTLTAVGPFQLPALQSGTLSRILSGTRPSVQTVLDVYLKRICSLDTSAFSALEVPDDNYLLTYLFDSQVSISVVRNGLCCSTVSGQTKARVMQIYTNAVLSCPITFLWLWPRTDHQPHSWHVPTDRIWRWTETTAWSRWWHSHTLWLESTATTALVKWNQMLPADR